MSRTIADASREYRQRQRDKLKRYEAALREIAGPREVYVGIVLRDIARNALQEG